MCGIAGIIAKQGRMAPQSKALAAMGRALESRGPDGAGAYSNANIGLVHRRLAIIDPAGGSQPIRDALGRVLVFNGEIYNYLELRQDMAGRYPFASASDSETILAAYQVYGLDFVNRLRGMYAFALYDPAANRTVLARDPFGIKPLYLAEDANGVAFASEIKALLASGIASADIDVGMLREVLARNYIAGLDTPYPSVKRLAAGEMRVYDRGVLTATQTRSFLPAATPQPIAENDALDRLDKIWRDSVDMHCRSDVGYGVFLSGGVDSSAVMAALAQRGDMSGIRTYTAYFDTPDVADERSFAASVVKATGAKGQEVAFTAHDFKTLLPAIAAYMDDPVADYAILPTWKLAATASLEQKVVLCGEGGDELFAGYGRYRPRWWKDWKQAFKPRDANMPTGWTALQRKQARDIAAYLPCDLLVKLDTCLMAHGLEGRTPFLDSEVARFAFALPDGLKLRGVHGKYLMKRWLDGKIPAAQAFRRKSGFTVPVGAWMAADAKRLADLLTRHKLVAELLGRDALAGLPARLQTPEGAKSCWALLYLALWYNGRTAQTPAKTIDEAL